MKYRLTPDTSAIATRTGRLILERKHAFRPHHYSARQHFEARVVAKVQRRARTIKEVLLSFLCPIQVTSAAPCVQTASLRALSLFLSLSLSLSCREGGMLLNSDLDVTRCLCERVTPAKEKVVFF